MLLLDKCFCFDLAEFLFCVQVPPESANQFGELVADPVTNELLHYTEKPETFVCTEFLPVNYSGGFSLILASRLHTYFFVDTFSFLDCSQVSDRINCGVYVFTPEIFTAIQGVSTQRKERGWLVLFLRAAIYTSIQSKSY